MQPGSSRLNRSRAPSADETHAWIGWRVDDVNGTMLGIVERVLSNDAGEPAWLVLAGFRLGDERKFLAPAFDAVGGMGRVWSPHLRATVSASAGLLAGVAAPDADRRLREHYASYERRRAA